MPLGFKPRIYRLGGDCLIQFGHGTTGDRLYSRCGCFNIAYLRPQKNRAASAIRPDLVASVDNPHEENCTTGNRNEEHTAPSIWPTRFRPRYISPVMATTVGASTFFLICDLFAAVWTRESSHRQILQAPARHPSLNHCLGIQHTIWGYLLFSFYLPLFLWVIKKFGGH